jgi:hypothetical protein
VWTANVTFAFVASLVTTQLFFSSDQAEKQEIVLDEVQAWRLVLAIMGAWFLVFAIFLALAKTK